MKFLATLITTLIMLSSMVYAEENPIAEIYGEKIFTRDLEIPASMLDRAKSSMSAEELEQWKESIYVEILAFNIMDAARNNFLKEENEEPSQKDIDGYVAYLHRAQKVDRKQRKLAREEIETQLKQSDLSDSVRSAAEQNLAVLESLSNSDVEPENDEERVQKLKDEQAVAAIMVPAWKFNQALYNKFGGRAAIQQMGLEPIDALEVFMQNLRESGAYEILNPAYKDVFKETDAYFEKDFQYIEKEKAEQYFEAPWWTKAALNP